MSEFEIFSSEWIAERDAKREEERKVHEERVAQLDAEGITGVLYAVAFNGWDGDIRYPNLGGRVDIDVRGRFYYGEHIFTSNLKKIYVKDGRTFAQTHHSLYELLDFNPTEIPEDYKYAFQDV